MNDFIDSTTSRRDFLRTLTLGAGATLVGSAALAEPLRGLAGNPATDRQLGVALVGLGLASSLYQLLPCLVLFGIGGNLTNISVNTQAVGVERLYKHKPIMASFHGLWSLAGFVAAAIGTFMIGHAVTPGVHFVLIALFIVAGLAVSAGSTVREDSGVDPDQPIFVQPDKELLGLGAIAFCALICEGAMFDWSGV